MTFRPSIFDRDIAAFFVPVSVQALPEGAQAACEQIGRLCPEIASRLLTSEQRETNKISATSVTPVIARSSVRLVKVFSLTLLRPDPSDA